MKVLLLYTILSCISFSAYAQGVAINSNNTQADSSAILDISSTSKGVLIPRMTLIERDMIDDPAIGLLIYQTDSIAGFYVYTGIAWSTLLSRENGWGVSGNSGTDPDTHFIGTTDSVPLRFRVNDVWAGELGNVLENSFFGVNAGTSNTTGAANTGFGFCSLNLNTTGQDNIGIGYKSLSNNTTGNNNTSIGKSALENNSEGYSNTAVGKTALFTNTTGLFNTAIGMASLFSNISGSYNTAFGNTALNRNTTGSANTAGGSSALFYNLEGFGNTAYGANALYNNNYGNANTANGYNALHGNTTGFGNTAIGSRAMESNSNGYLNVAIGNNALLLNSSGFANTTIGANCMTENTTASANTAVGHGAMSHTTIGYSNTSVGQLSLSNNTTGIQNTAVGVSALANNISGYINTALGYSSGTGGGGGWNNTISIGNHGYLNGSHSQAFIGNLSTLWTGGNTGWYTYSDARVKKDVQEDVKGIDFISRLRPVTYHRDIDTQTTLTGNTPTEDFEGKYEIEEIKFSGFLAQEVAEAAVASGYDFSGVTTPRHDKELYTLSYEVFVVPLVKAVQEQQIIIENLNKKIESIEQQLADIELLLVQKKNQN